MAPCVESSIERDESLPKYLGIGVERQINLESQVRFEPCEAIAVGRAGLLGRDIQGETLERELILAGADTSGLVWDNDRPTTSKLRIVAHSQQTDQQIVRVDRESRSKVTGEAAAGLLDRALKALPGVDAVLISDYNKGVLVSSMALPLMEACRPLLDAQHVEYVLIAGPERRSDGLRLVWIGDTWVICSEATIELPSGSV